MRSLDLNRFALSVCVATVMLAGCGGSQPPIGAPGAMPQSAARKTSSQDLLYADTDSGMIFVYSLPDGKFEQSFHIGLSSVLECSDAIGDVFVTSPNLSGSGSIYEFAHGGSKPVATLTDPGEPYACAVDPTTGNLAVANSSDPGNPYDPHYGDVAIYAGAQGQPTRYYSSVFTQPFSCTYDDSGNLYILASAEGYDYPQLVRLPHGSGPFEQINVDKTITGGVNFDPNVQWDGKYVTVSSSTNSVKDPTDIYQLSISGSHATVVGTTELTVRAQHHGRQSWIQGNVVLGIYGPGHLNVGVWPYPKGGKPKSILKNVSNPQDGQLWGVSISVGSSH